MENREMQTSNTEEMVTISRAEYERLQQEKARNAKLEAKLAAREQEQAQVITSLTLQNPAPAGRGSCRCTGRGYAPPAAVGASQKR